VYGFDPLPAGMTEDRRSHFLGLQANIWTEHIRTEERVEYMTFPRAAAVAELGWSPEDRLSWSGFRSRLPQQMKRYEMLGIRAHQAPGGDGIGGDATPAPTSRRSSHDLRSCTQKVLLSLEDDAPLSGPRATFLVDIMNPCWIYAGADLGHVTAVTAAVGQVPFNFQLGADLQAIKLSPPDTPSGELEIRLDGCEGERVAVLPLRPAIARNAVTELPSVHIAPRDGKHDLCLRFTQRSLDPMWVVDWVELE
jgi:hexosaminidase